MSKVTVTRSGDCLVLTQEFSGVPCVTPELLRSFRGAQDLVERGQPRRQIITSSHPAVFNLGGDLELFLESIEHSRWHVLREYGYSCAALTAPSVTGYGGRVTTVAVVAGQALGGGFELALSNRVIIAEEQATFGFPETLIGLFPGMGAVPLLEHRIGPVLARRLLNGGTYTAREMFALGVVDEVVPTGVGLKSALAVPSSRHMEAAFDFGHVDDVYESICRQVDLWVSAAADMSPRSTRNMRTLLRRQSRKFPLDSLNRMAQSNRDRGRRAPTQRSERECPGHLTCRTRPGPPT